MIKNYYTVHIDLELNYKHPLFLFKDLVGAEIPIEFEGVTGKVKFPDFITKGSESSPLCDVFYSTNKSKSVGSFFTNDAFKLYHLRCLFESENELDENFVQKLNTQIDSVVSIIERYKFGVFGNNYDTVTSSYKIDCYMINQITRKKTFPGTTLFLTSNFFTVGISKRMFSVILAISNKNFEFNFTHTLLLEAIDHFLKKLYRNCIINCCTIAEIVVSEQIVKKLTKNGSIASDIEIILKSISGLYELVKAAKDLGVKFPEKFNSPKGFDYQKLANLRNYSVHRGISPLDSDCIKYIQGIKKLLMFYRIKLINY